MWIVKIRKCFKAIKFYINKFYVEKKTASKPGQAEKQDKADRSSEEQSITTEQIEYLIIITYIQVASEWVCVCANML